MTYFAAYSDQFVIVYFGSTGSGKGMKMPLVRRNYQRVNINKTITVTVNGRELAYAECRNISMGGMCISVKDSVEKDQCGTVELTYECENESITFKGEFTICWVRITDEDTQEFGFKFDYYDSTDLTNLARIVLSQISIREDE